MFFLARRGQKAFYEENACLTYFGKSEIINSLTIIESYTAAMLYLHIMSFHSKMYNKHYALHVELTHSASLHVISLSFPMGKMIFLYVYSMTTTKIMFTLKYDALLNERKGFFLLLFREKQIFFGLKKIFIS